MAKRQYPLGIRLSCQCSIDDSSWGKGLPKATIVAELVEDRGGEGTYVCMDNHFGDVADGYYCWMQTDQRFMALDWDDTTMRGVFDELSYDRRMMTGNRVKMEEAVLMAKTLTKIHKSIMKAQDKTGLSVSTFDSYLRLLMIAIKPEFLVVRSKRGEQRTPAMDSDMVNAYNQLRAEVSAFWERTVQARQASEAA